MYRLSTGPIPWLAAWLALVLLAGGVLPGAERPGLARPAAAPQPLPFNVTAGGALWESIDNALCESVTAFQIDDAELLATGQSDAYDNAFCMIVNSAPFVAPDPVDLTGTTVTAGPVTIAGLSVTQQFFFLTTLPVVRVLASFTNPTAAPITATVAFETDLGSDSATSVVASSSGDTTFNTADRWVITADFSTDPVDDPAILHVFRGPGSPSVTPSAAGLGLKGNGCSVSVPGDPEARCVAFNLTVPPGATRRLMLFDMLNASIAAAQANATQFNTNPAPGSELISGLTQQQLTEIVNWDFPPPTPTPTPTNTPTATSTPTPTNTSTSTPTATSTPTSTPTATATPTSTPVPPTATSSPTSTAVTATPTPSPTPPVVPTNQNVPPLTGQSGTSCTTQIGGVCEISSPPDVTGTWTKTSSGTFVVTATGPAGTAVGGIPAIFLPTTVGVEGFPCSPVTATLRTVCTGTTVGDLLLNGLVTVRFPLAAGGTADVIGRVVAPAAPNVLSLLPPLLPAVLPPPLPPPAPLLLPPPPGPLSPPPAMMPEVPVIPEADNVALVALGLALLATLSTVRRRRRGP